LEPIPETKSVAHVKKAGRALTPKRGMSGMVRARIDPALKARAETILNDLGLNASDAIRLFYTQVALSKGLPFEVKIPNATTRKAILDARAGKNLKHYASTAEMFEKLGL
jgi:DNA-damage-inducible protein J